MNEVWRGGVVSTHTTDCIHTPSPTRSVLFIMHFYNNHRQGSCYSNSNSSNVLCEQSHKADPPPPHGRVWYHCISQLVSSTRSCPGQSDSPFTTQYHPKFSYMVWARLKNFLGRTATSLEYILKTELE